MGNLLFSPSGRIGPSEYMRGMIIVGVIAAVLGLLGLVSSTLGTIGGLISIVLLYVFFALGIKRSHDAGKTGWLSITHFLLLMLISTVAGWLLMTVFGVSMTDVVDAAMSGDTQAVEDATRASVIPSAIASLVAYPVTAFIVNMLNPHDTGPNQYDTNTVSTDTFS